MPSKLNDVALELAESPGCYEVRIKLPKQSRYVRGVLMLIKTLGISSLSQDERRIVAQLEDQWRKLLATGRS